jgi:hypothetical protein
MRHPQKSRRGQVISFILSILFLYSLADSHCVALAQGYLDQTGLPTFTTSELVEMGVVNLANGNLHIEIPLASTSQRGGMQYEAKLVYDSRIWKQLNGVVWSPEANGGWKLIETRPGSYHSDQIICSALPPFNVRNINFSYTDFSGTTHRFPAFLDLCTGESSNGMLPALDGSGYLIQSLPGQLMYVYDPDGIRVTGTSMTDPNGNSMWTENNDGTGSMKDTLNRKIMITYSNGQNGCTATTCYDVLKSDGSRGLISVTNTTVYLNTAFGDPVTEYSGSFSVPETIQLPDGTTYHFSYNSGTASGHYGELTGMTLPTAGWVNFGYLVWTD